MRLAASVVALFRANAQAKGLALMLDLEPGVVDRVIGDAQRLKQVLLNLVGNAIKFTERGSVTLRLRAGWRTRAATRRALRGDRHRHRHPPEAMQRLFQPFHQVDRHAQPAQRRHRPGPGDQPAHRRGDGRRHRASRASAGLGSAFHFELSFERDPSPTPPAPIDSAMARSTRAVAPGRHRAGRRGQPGQPHDRREMLQSLGLRHHRSAATASRRSTLLRRRSVDLVLMDCQMPVMDGYTATMQIRERERRLGLPRMPIVALTANAFDEDAAHALEVGMDAHLAKPYTRDQLREMHGELAVALHARSMPRKRCAPQAVTPVRSSPHRYCRCAARPRRCRARCA